MADKTVVKKRLQPVYRGDYRRINAQRQLFGAECRHACQKYCGAKVPTSFEFADFSLFTPTENAPTENLEKTND